MLTSLETSISPDRLSTYSNAAKQNKTNAVLLYLWNTRISGAFHCPLQAVEVTLRNTVNETLIDTYGDNWPHDPKFRNILTQPTIQNIEKVIGRITGAGYQATLGRIVAGLSFDFWAWLFTSDFDRPIWQTRLRGAFPNLPGSLGRGDVRNLVVAVKTLRNRVAHYEPVLNMDLSGIHTNIIRVVHFRCADTAAWLRASSEVQTILREKPRF